MHTRRTHILYTILLLAGIVFLAPLSIRAQDEIIPDSSSGIVPEGQTETETETEAGPLMETETVYEIPPGIADGLKKDTPVGEAAGYTPEEAGAFLEKIYQANSAEAVWEKHKDVSATFRMYDEDAQMWKEYSTFYATPLLYYSDDWSPGLEELRLLIYGENGCVEDYTQSMRFVRFLNASGVPYRDSGTDPVTLEEDTGDELLLRIHRAEHALFVITRLTESSIARFGLEDPAEDSFYSCLYLLDPDSLEVKVIRIFRHDSESSTANEVRSLTYSYDLGMSMFVETGYKGLLRHLLPESEWAPEYLREVTVTLDPGTDAERTESLTTLKGDPVSITLPDGYELYTDESLTVRWVDNGDYSHDLFLWAAPSM